MEHFVNSNLRPQDKIVNTLLHKISDAHNWDIIWWKRVRKQTIVMLNLISNTSSTHGWYQISFWIGSNGWRKLSRTEGGLFPRGDSKAWWWLNITQMFAPFHWAWPRSVPALVNLVSDTSISAECFQCRHTQQVAMPLKGSHYEINLIHY